jgi:uncharacterized protein
LKGKRMETELMCPECGVIVPDPGVGELCPEGCGKTLVPVPDMNPTGTHGTVAPKKSGRGFASMSPEKQREIARKGGRAAHAKGTAHEWNREEARAAGSRGGTVSRGGRGKLPFNKMEHSLANPPSEKE